MGAVARVEACWMGGSGQFGATVCHCRSLQLGTFDTQHGEYEWKHAQRVDDRGRLPSAVLPTPASTGGAPRAWPALHSLERTLSHRARPEWSGSPAPGKENKQTVPPLGRSKVAECPLSTPGTSPSSTPRAAGSICEVSSVETAVRAKRGPTSDAVNSGLVRLLLTSSA